MSEVTKTREIDQYFSERIKKNKMGNAKYFCYVKFCYFCVQLHVYVDQCLCVAKHAR